MNGKKLFQENLRHIQDMKLNETKATLSDLILKEEIKRVRRVEAVKKCNRKRYASLKIQKELEAENMALKKEIEELKQLKGFKESPQVKEITSDEIPEFEDMETSEENEYIDTISDLLEGLTESKDDNYNMSIYKEILKKNNLRRPSSYPILERRRKQYKLIIESIKKEFE
ncbi:MAG: hypothetical protein EBW68_00805 [Actinobacteria bacterium]|nr:hypothetical protein [Actinomycetota bacterium]